MYLDNAATTPLLPKVKDDIVKWLDFFGNPSSMHEEGRIVKNRLYDARDDIAEFINGHPENIIFTSSGSAANNLVIRGLNDSYLFLYTPTCHKSMRLACENKPNRFDLKMNSDGTIDKEWLEKLVLKYSKRMKIVLCYEIVNSEIGVLQDVKYLDTLIHSNGGLILADATAYIPHTRLDVTSIGADYITFSAHKLGALKGVGVVYKNNVEEQIEPLVYGSQEQGLFGGTENVIGIISLQSACNNYDYSKFNPVGVMHRFVSECISKINGAYEIAGDSEGKIPYVSMYCFKGVLGEQLAELLDEEGYQVSTGSACNSGDVVLSKTLLAIGIPEEDIPCCIRVSFSGNESMVGLSDFIFKLNKCINTLRLF